MLVSCNGSLVKVEKKNFSCKVKVGGNCSKACVRSKGSKTFAVLLL